MTEFKAKDSDDEERGWKECNDRKCPKFGQSHYHKVVIYSCPLQSNTLDSYFSGSAIKVSPGEPKLSADEAKSLRWKYKVKGLGRVKRYRNHPY